MTFGEFVWALGTRLLISTQNHKRWLIKLEMKKKKDKERLGCKFMFDFKICLNDLRRKTFK